MEAGRGAPSVQLNREVWQRIWDATLLAVPYEACGCLGGTFDATVGSGGVIAVDRAVALDNETTQDSRYHFLIPPDRVRRAARGLERESSQLIGFYHSHPRGGPDLSAEDIERAWPGHLHLVTSLGPAREVRVRAFEVKPVDGLPHELPVRLVDGRCSSLLDSSPLSTEVALCPE